MKREKNQQVMMLSGIVVAAILAFVIVIYLVNNQSAKSNVNFDELQQTRLDDGGYLLGDPSAPITIVEFADFLCGHCQTYKETMNRVIEEFVVTGEANFEFRMIPTSQGSSENLFRQAECIGASAQSNFWEAHDEFFDLAASGTRADTIGRQAADNLGVSYAEVLECSDGMQRNGTEQFNSDRIAGTEGSVRGTPTVFVRYGGVGGSMQALANTQPSFDILKTAIESVNSQ
jgi:protein-disulfide isomerase